MPNTNDFQPSQVRISQITPEIDCGATPIKRVIGDKVIISAEIVAASPLIVGGVIRYRADGRRYWEQASLIPNESNRDMYSGEFVVNTLGQWRYAIEAWVDRAATWQHELRRRLEGSQIDLDTELATANRRFGTNFATVEEALKETFEDHHGLVRSATFSIEVDPELAQFGAWYELFPRSFGGFTGVRKELPQLAELGFDVLYLPPIHPIGHTHRKGRNNSLVADSSDPGSPWAIGNAAGGHTAVNEDLGTLEEFDLLVKDAEEFDIAVSIDLAFQCSPDHPWLEEHPEWFEWREDGTVRFAENPPKRYEDIVNFNFDTPHWRELWDALLGVVQFWVKHGIYIFRVDNPHTKPLHFWEWLISEVRSTHEEVIFLSEAFTRPALMSALAKVGFSQSYSYFTWRNTRDEIMAYLEELSDEMNEYFRPNFFVNTPDILSDYLKEGGPPAFAVRAILAATLSPSYGVYSGFESYENTPFAKDSEEYRNSEKYEIKSRNLDGPLMPTISRLNYIRRSSSVFKRLNNVRFLSTANNSIIAYIKHDRNADQSDLFIICVNLDPKTTNEGLIELPPDLNLPARFSAVDVLADTAYSWTVGGNFVRLGPGAAHILRVG